jgi:hypothetical protein
MRIEGTIAPMPDPKGNKLFVNLGASQARRRIKGFGHGVRKVPVEIKRSSFTRQADGIFRNLKTRSLTWDFQALKAT